MYPESPNITQWRLAAASRARAAGADIPADFDGSQEANTALSAAARAALTKAQNEFVLANPEKFPPQFLDSARRYLGSSAATADYSTANYGVFDMLGDFTGEVVEQVKDQYSLAGIGAAAGEAFAKAGGKVETGPKSSGIGWGTVIMLGVAAGAGWYYLRRAS